MTEDSIITSIRISKEAKDFIDKYSINLSDWVDKRIKEMMER